MGFTNWLSNYMSDYRIPGDSVVMSKVKAENAKQRVNTPNTPGYTGNTLQNLLTAYQTSAIKAEQEATLSAQQWQKQQADIAWQRNQQSAREQMNFQKQQADIAWQREQSSALKQMQFQEKMWKKSTDYNTEMSNTAYQRAVSDLRKAGLNPVLAVMQGGASTPNASVPAGASSSAKAMSGASASSPSPNGYKADYSRAKTVDVMGKFGIFSDITDMLTSALKILF